MAGSCQSSAFQLQLNVEKGLYSEMRKCLRGTRVCSKSLGLSIRERDGSVERKIHSKNKVTCSPNAAVPAKVIN